MNAKQTATIAKIAFGPWPHIELTDAILEAYHISLHDLRFDDAMEGLKVALRDAGFPPPPKAIRSGAHVVARNRLELVKQDREAERRKELREDAEVSPEKVEEFLRQLREIAEGKKIA